MHLPTRPSHSNRYSLRLTCSQTAKAPRPLHSPPSTTHTPTSTRRRQVGILSRPSCPLQSRGDLAGHEARAVDAVGRVEAEQAAAVASPVGAIWQQLGHPRTMHRPRRAPSSYPSARDGPSPSKRTLPDLPPRRHSQARKSKKTTMDCHQAPRQRHAAEVAVEVAHAAEAQTSALLLLQHDAAGSPTCPLPQRKTATMVTTATTMTKMPAP